MNTCKRCGATLGDQAQYCMQCGRPVQAPESVEPTALEHFLQPAFVAGAALGALSSIPIVSAGNFICCMWVIGGGALAAWLLRKNHPRGPAAVAYGDGAFVGVLSGSFGAIVATVISVPVRLLTAEALRDHRALFEETFTELEGPLRELFLRLLSPEISFVTILVTFFINLVTFSLFAMIGGILLVAAMGKKA